MDSITLLLLQRLIVFLRFGITNTHNLEAVNQMLEAINSMNSSEETNMSLLRISHLLGHEFDPYKEETKEVQTLSIQEKNDIISFFQDALEKLGLLFANNKLDQAYDLCDAIHVFPELFPNPSKKRYKDYWKTFIKPYQKKWNDSFFKRSNCF